MTIEQKAKAYDEAISLIKDYNRDEEGFICVKPENIFPELKESKDEKIRNQIINFIEEYGNPIHCEWQKDWIAWLEKQGEPTDINPSEFDLRLNKLLKQFETLPKEELASSLSFYLNVVQNDGTYKREEKQGEQKPADKVKPKFHEGEWVVWKNKCYKVNYNGCGYELIDQNGLSTWLEYGTVDTSARLYDVAKDAKDGDVLYSLDSKQPFIFKHRSPNEQAEVYCGINIYGKFFVGNTKDCIITTDKYVPATKEQRDILMKAMTDAGYAFDFKKLELKKIVVPIFNIGDTIVEKDLDECSYGTIKDIKNGQYIFTDGSSINIDEQEEWQLKTSTNIEQKPADWSEEDEKMLNSALWHIKNSCSNGGKNSGEFEVYNWLKSLKPKYQWKPTIRQLTALEYAVNDNTLSCDELYTLNELYEQLKKL